MTFCSQLNRLRLLSEPALAWITPEGDRAGYLTCLLNRLMYLYFIQARGWLNGEKHYLRRRWQESSRQAPDRFYRDFFLPLCCFGPGTPEAGRGPFAAWFAGIPYLGEGLFSVHPMERRYGLFPEVLLSGSVPAGIAIPDAAFGRWLEFFDCWEWSLDDPDAESGRRLGPGILGFATERSLDRKKVGAYFTGDDVTGYICRNTLLPRLLGMPGSPAGPCRPGEQPALDIQRISRGEGIGRYLPLPIKSAACLPAETKREYEARRSRCHRLLQEFSAREIATPDDFVTGNLDLAALALDLVTAAEDACWLYRFYRQALQRITVLDPTCGSGSFLCAALKLLHPLYVACLRRMEELGEQTEVPEIAAAFRAELALAGSNHDYFACRNILENNLYGLDIVEEAAESCRLHLYLKLLSHLPPRPARGDRPWPAGQAALPDLGRNVRAGNALVGYTRAAPREGEAPAEPAPAEPRDELNAPLYGEFRTLGKAAGVRSVRHFTETHHPFHWFREFPAVMGAGGFDAVIGNPPYVDLDQVKEQYQVIGCETESCGNVCACVVERSLALLNRSGRLGVLLPISAVSGEDYRPLLSCLSGRSLWISTYSNRPAKLFDSVEQRLCIVITGRSSAPSASVVRVSSYQHWYQCERPHLFARLTYCRGSRWPRTGMPIKSGTATAMRIFARIMSHRGRLGDMAGGGSAGVWLHDGPTYWVRALPFEPNQGLPGGRSGHYHRISVPTAGEARILAAILSSTTFYFFYKMVSNCRDLGRKEWAEFPIDPFSPAIALQNLGEELEARLRETAAARTRVYPSGSVRYKEYYPAQAKAIIDRIDRVLAGHYGFTDEELDFLLHYELKYRLGRGERRPKREKEHI